MPYDTFLNEISLAQVAEKVTKVRQDLAHNLGKAMRHPDWNEEKKEVPTATRVSVDLP